MLIPRPETEELIELILQHPESRTTSRLLDVGTGSGCIAHALTALLPEVSESFAIEVSSEAIPIAQRNFDTLREETGRLVTLWKKDLFALVEEHTPPSTPFDLIVSNPPYIHPKEADEMSKQVLDWEPTTALFAPSERPTIFYDEIARLKHKGYLKNKAHIFLEINPLYAQETVNNMRSIIGENNIHLADILNDMYGKKRFIHIQIQE